MVMLLWNDWKIELQCSFINCQRIYDSKQNFEISFDSIFSLLRSIPSLLPIPSQKTKDKIFKKRKKTKLQDIQKSLKKLYLFKPTESLLKKVGWKSVVPINK